MPRNLKRHYGKGDLHFIAFSCYERRPLLGTVRARNRFVINDKFHDVGSTTWSV